MLSREFYMCDADSTFGEPLSRNEFERGLAVLRATEARSAATSALKRPAPAKPPYSREWEANQHAAARMTGQAK